MSNEKVEGETNPIGDNLPIPPRDDLVKTAAKFLSSPNVVNSPNETKVAFLKKKGLSDAEIDLAMKRSEVIIQSRNFESSSQPQQVVPYVSWPPQTPWSRYRDMANTVALVGGIAYAIYWFYKKYIAPFLFGGKKSLDSRLSDMDKMMTDSFSEVFSLVNRFKEEEKATERKMDSLSRQIDELKNEISSLKKLMLNRKQFPTTTSGPLTIPSWQIASSTEEKEAEEEGVGSGTNGSDSSLEMIKE